MEEGDKVAAAILSAAHLRAHPGGTAEEAEARLIAKFHAFLRAVTTKPEFEPVRVDAGRIEK
ncbi:MAG: hypothetical protein AB7F08_11425 [Dongiaceae bacterium]|jgi:hypothetical protein